MSADAIVYTALQNCPLSGGGYFEGYWRFMYRRDSEQDARGFVFGYLQAKPNPIYPQSGCAVYALAVEDTAEVDGRIQWRGKEIDIFGVPYITLNGLAPTLCEELGKQRGIIHSGLTKEQPVIAAGVVMCIGGDDGLPKEQRIWGGSLHVLLFTGDDGSTAEGGQPDEKNSNFLSAVKAKRREVYQRADGHWWLRTAGTQEVGRRIRWWYQAGDLPCR